MAYKFHKIGQFNVTNTDAKFNIINTRINTCRVVDIMFLCMYMCLTDSSCLNKVIT